VVRPPTPPTPPADQPAEHHHDHHDHHDHHSTPLPHETILIPKGVFLGVSGGQRRRSRSADAHWGDDAP
jgi:hypothetical protein